MTFLTRIISDEVHRMCEDFDTLVRWVTDRPEYDGTRWS